MADPTPAQTVEVALDRVAKGGAALGNGPDGRVVFVTGGLPGERVLATITKTNKSFHTATAVEILEQSEHRRATPCNHAAECGGCDWQHATEQEQASLRKDIVVDSLRRLARLDDVDVRMGPTLPGENYRTSIRVAVAGGRAGYRAHRSHDVLTPDACPVVHPLVEELLVDGRFGDADEVVIKVGARTGERLVMARPNTEGFALPDDVVVVGTNELSEGREAFIHEEVAGRRFRISAQSFFQCRPDGAEALVSLAAAITDDTEGPMLDAYSGVGLFGGLLANGRPLTTVESSRSSVADARVNLADLPQVEVVEARVEKWQPQNAAVVIADPARKGLAAEGVDAMVATGCQKLALVSCDPASLARDAGLLIKTGFQLDHVTVVDLFGQTSHVEAVSSFTRLGETGQ